MSESRKANYVIFLGCTAALGGLLFGFDIAIITGAGPYLAKEFALSDLGLGWAFSSLLFGCALGCVIAGKLSDRWGRKKLLLLIALLFACTSIETALAPNFTAFVTARFLAGMAVGGVSLLTCSSFEYNFTISSEGFLPSKLSLEPIWPMLSAKLITG